MFVCVLLSCSSSAFGAETAKAEPESGHSAVAHALEAASCERPICELQVSHSTAHLWLMPVVGARRRWQQERRWEERRTRVRSTSMEQPALIRPKVGRAMEMQTRVVASRRAMGNPCNCATNATRLAGCGRQLSARLSALESSQLSAIRNLNLLLYLRHLKKDSRRVVCGARRAQSANG